MTPKKTHTFKVVVVGPPGVGKSALLKQMALGKDLSEVEMFSGSSKVLQADGGRQDMKRKEFNIGHYLVVLQVWDAVGFDERSITAQFYKESVGIIFMYDSTSKDSLYDLKAIEDKCKEKIDQFEFVTCFLVANKIDEANGDEYIAEGEQYKSQHKDLYTEFFPVSAKLGDNVDKMLKQMAVSLMECHKRGAIQPVHHSDSVVVLGSTESTSSPHRSKCTC